MDPLSDVLSLLKPRNYLSAGWRPVATGRSSSPDQQAAIKCGAVVSGQCWLSVEGVADAVRLETATASCCRAAGPSALPAIWICRRSTPARSFPLPAPAESPRTMAAAISFFSSRFALSGDHAGILLRMLPPIVHIRSDADHSALRWPVERMMQDLRERQPVASSSSSTSPT